MFSIYLTWVRDRLADDQSDGIAASGPPILSPPGSLVKNSSHKVWIERIPAGIGGRVALMEQQPPGASNDIFEASSDPWSIQGDNRSGLGVDGLETLVGFKAFITTNQLR
ncbi:uncharacterized protein ARMOST_20606 [Armillaria ostoyae]|uniref:Uncharacterized protein n=1 Tax=Armillaria ostoyae TaxID=47428 RepID=A0A284S7T4_ARMOS|nr:uncharacterized protein ARMOST_20606 [Armillaria ostoyae]